MQGMQMNTYELKQPYMWSSWIQQKITDFHVVFKTGKGVGAKLETGIAVALQGKSGQHVGPQKEFPPRTVAQKKRPGVNPGRVVKNQSLACRSSLDHPVELVTGAGRECVRWGSCPNNRIPSGAGAERVGFE